MGSALDTIAPIALAVIGNIVAPGIGSALGLLDAGSAISAGAVGSAIGAGLGSGGVNYSHTHNLGDALKAGALSGGGSFAGGQIASNILGPSLGTIGGNLNLPGSSSSDVGELFSRGSSGLPGALPESTMNIADQFGANAFGGANVGQAALPWSVGSGSSDIASALGSTLSQGVNNALGTPVSQIVGSQVGNSLASQYANPGQPSMRGQYPWIPAAPGQPGGGASVGMPSSLAGMSGLTPLQQATGLATQGVYGGGLGPQEQGYFKNLVQNQLVPSYGQTAQLSSLAPIENTYLSNLGFGNPSSSSSLAQELSQWNPSA